MSDSQSQKSWNDPQKIDSAIGWLVVAVVGCIVFVIMGRNLIPYVQMYARYAAAPAELLGQPWSVMVGPLLKLIGALGGILLFCGIQMLEVRPLFLAANLPEGEARNQKLRNAWIWFCVALALDVIHCFVFWPPVNSSLGWGVFRGGFAMALINKGNIIQTFGTLFGGMGLYLTIKSVRRHW